jgi:protein-L-isoaspartate(D-aspartate) O-methyltransferase
MEENNIELARFNMIEQQIRPWNVPDDRVLEQMAAIPREQFVSEQFRGLAFSDTELSIGEGQKMLPPRIEAHLLQALNIEPGDRILEVGTGSGYLTACLAGLGARVISVDIHKSLSSLAAERLASLEIKNAECKIADALAGPINGGPFDAIAVSGSVPSSDQAEQFKAQLSDGGRLFIVIGEAPVMQMQLITRTGSSFETETIMQTELTPLEGVTYCKPFSL